MPSGPLAFIHHPYRYVDRTLFPNVRYELVCFSETSYVCTVTKTGGVYLEGVFFNVWLFELIYTFEPSVVVHYLEQFLTIFWHLPCAYFREYLLSLQKAL
jgi:hypothetical protein